MDTFLFVFWGAVGAASAETRWDLEDLANGARSAEVRDGVCGAHVFVGTASEPVYCENWAREEQEGGGVDESHFQLGSSGGLEIIRKVDGCSIGSFKYTAFNAIVAKDCTYTSATIRQRQSRGCSVRLVDSQMVYQ